MCANVTMCRVKILWKQKNGLSLIFYSNVKKKNYGLEKYPLGTP